MARSHLTLAALATAAVPGLDIAQARTFSHGARGSFDAAVVSDRDGRDLIIRVPREQPAETEQSADLVALRALTVGIRSRLPFDVPEYVGQAPFRGTRAVVYDFLPGDAFDADTLTGHAGVSGSIGRAIAAIHGLPTAFIGTAGLAQQTAQECRAAAIDLIDRTANTGYLPAALLRRWEQATDDETLWQFAPCVIHGSLAAESFLISDDAVSGVLGWSGLGVGDAAHDVHWLLSARGDAAEGAIAAYTEARQGRDLRITQRALLYAELELARWLLHGAATRNQTIIDDAIAMLDGLVDNVHNSSSHPLSPENGPVLDVSDVENMLDQTPRSAAGTGEQHAAMQTDSYDFSGLSSGEWDDADDPGSAAPSDGDAGTVDGTDTASSSLASSPSDDTAPFDRVSATDAQARTRSSSE